MNVNFVDIVSQWAHVKDDILAEFSNLIDQSRFVGGPPVDEFKKKMAEFTGAKYAIGTSSGTASLVAILKGLGLESGDRVGVQANTFIATAFAVEHAGLEVVLVDDWAALCASDNQAELDCIIPVHMYGRVNTILMNELKDWADLHGVVIVEDACQAIGAEGAGTFGIATAYSFYPAKNLGCWGQGGAITTNNIRLAKFINSYIDQGSTAKGVHEIIGDNLRLDTLQAVVLNKGLDLINDWNNARRSVAQIYWERLKDLGDIRPLLSPDEEDQYGNNDVFHLFPLLVTYEHPTAIEDLQKHLGEANIHSGRHYPYEIASQLPYRERGYSTPFAHHIAHSTMTIPMHPYITEEQANYVCNIIEEWVDIASVKEAEFVARFDKQ